MSSIADRLDGIRSRVDAAAAKSGRSVGDVELMAVSKTFPAEIVAEAVDAGQYLLGENKVQELLAKKPQLPSRVRWHLIGHLQSNKVRKILPAVEALHGVSSLDLAKDIQRIATELGLYPKVYLEVNLAVESTKYGFTAEQLRADLDQILNMDRLDVLGLMCIPPFGQAAEDSRKYFIQLRHLRDELAQSSGVPLTGLSMGMSHDFEIAIDEGSTLVRVGSAIFGGRA